MDTIREKAEAAVASIIRDMTDRRGFRQEWDQIDQDIKREIIDRWVYLVEHTFTEEKHGNDQAAPA